MRIIYDNVIDYTTTTISAATEAADLPAENVRHPFRSKVYRTLATQANEYLRFDLGSALSVQCAILLDHTLTAEDSNIRLQGGAAPGATTVNEAFVFNSGTMALFLSSPSAAYRYWQIVFTKSAAAVTRDIGRVFLGLFDECTRSFRYGSFSEIPVDLSGTDRAIGGQTYSDIKSTYREVKGDFFWIDDAQATKLKTLINAVGIHTPFFLSVDPTNKPYDLLYYGKFSKLGQRTVEHTPGGYKWTIGFEFNEEIQCK